MGLKSGDKARYYRERRKRNVRRMRLRAFHETLKQEPAAPPSANPRVTAPEPA